MAEEPKKVMTDAEREALRSKLLVIQDDLAQPIARRLFAGAVRFVLGLDPPKEPPK